MRNYLHALVWYQRHLSGSLQVRELEYLKEFIRVDDICVDVGAHAGSWSFPLGRIAKEGRVFSFEALPYYAETLKLTRWMMRAENINVINMAVADYDREVKLVWRGKDGERLTGLTHLLGEDEKSQHIITVKGVALDSFFEGEKNRIGLIKIDVEGAELNVLRGAEKVIENHRPIFFSEINDAFLRRYSHSINHVNEFLKKHEYQVISLENGQFLDSELSDSGSFDVLLVPKEKCRRFRERSSFR